MANSSTALSPGDRIGIVGGGQLGRMLAMAAARLGFQVIVLDPQEDAPAFQCASDRIVAEYNDLAALEKLANKVSVLTYEFENVPVDALLQIKQRTAIFPNLGALEKSQDRLLEKSFFQEIGIKTASFLPVKRSDQIGTLHDRLGSHSILKTRRLGYDGKGQIRLSGSSPEMLSDAIDLATRNECILEQVVDFACEISVIACRDERGKIISYDPARNVHSEGILRTSTLPAGIDSEVAEAASTHTAHILEALEYVGVIGVEWFVLPNGEVMANEFAPRVHNSGHWTEAACVVSQFEQHIRAISGLPLLKPVRHSDCEMHNIIGEEYNDLSELMEMPNALVHLYGKSEARPGRKMGHYTVLRSKS